MIRSYAVKLLVVVLVSTSYVHACIRPAGLHPHVLLEEKLAIGRRSPAQTRVPRRAWPIWQPPLRSGLGAMYSNNSWPPATLAIEPDFFFLRGDFSDTACQKRCLIGWPFRSRRDLGMLVCMQPTLSASSTLVSNATHKKPRGGFEEHTRCRFGRCIVACKGSKGCLADACSSLMLNSLMFCPVASPSVWYNSLGKNSILPTS